MHMKSTDKSKGIKPSEINKVLVVYYIVVSLSLWSLHSENVFGLASLTLGVIISIAIPLISCVTKYTIPIHRQCSLLFAFLCVCHLALDLVKKGSYSQFLSFQGQIVTAVATCGSVMLGLLLIRISARTRHGNIVEDDNILLVLVVAGLVFSALLYFFRQLTGFGWTDTIFIFLDERGIIPPIEIFLFCIAIAVLLFRVRAFTLVARNNASTNNQTTDFNSHWYQETADRAHQIVNYSIWAIPILGFLGTVIGISQAVQVLGTAVSDSGNSDGTDIRLAMEPLAVAFDTTTLALALALVLVFIHTLVLRAEQKAISKISRKTY